MKITITGGAGYVGSRLVPHLLGKGHGVTVLDTFWFGDNLPQHINLTKLKGDIRHKSDLIRAIDGADVVIHLACVSNDPSFINDPKLGKSINYDCFYGLLNVVTQKRVPRFIYASSSSVYGVSKDSEVTEDSDKQPLTDYSKFKLKCENDLNAFGTGPGSWVILRPATVCGYAPRFRNDLVVNILTMSALAKGQITLFGRDQKRPNIHIDDMVAAYDWALSAPRKVVDRQIFNVGFDNLTLLEIAELVKESINRNVPIKFEEANDPRSYHISSKKILKAGFKPRFTISDAIKDLEAAYRLEKIVGPFTKSIYTNIKQMQELGL